MLRALVGRGIKLGMSFFSTMSSNMEPMANGSDPILGQIPQGLQFPVLPSLTSAPVGTHLVAGCLPIPWQVLELWADRASLEVFLAVRVGQVYHIIHLPGLGAGHLTS